jgi:hypothetical protein
MEPSNPRHQPMGPRIQGIFWILTVPHHQFTPYLPNTCQWIAGQLENSESGFLHWQFIVAFKIKASLAACRATFGPAHAELTRSAAAAEYCWKLDTRVDGTQFELGLKPFKRNSKIEWESVWELAKSGDFDAIPASVRVQSYRTLRSIHADYARPVAMERTCTVYWGITGSGKSRRAWDEAGLDAYPKDPRSKFWCGYRDQPNVVLDEFRGGIDISHLLRWLDRYPVIVEVKGGSAVLSAQKIWITSNISPRSWYPELDPETQDALLRRLTITHFDVFN